MDVEDNRNKNEVSFGIIDYGSVYEHYESFYMKIDPPYEHYNAINLDTGTVIRECEDTIVHPVRARVIIE